MSHLARGEFSVVIASLGAVAAAFVLLTAIAGPLAARRLNPPAPRQPAVHF